MINAIQEGWKDFSHLFYPIVCAGCKTALSEQEKVICNACYGGLPRTGYAAVHGNPIAQLFWGKIDVQHAAAWLFFYKGGIVQQMLHSLKYQGNKDVGRALGMAMADDILVGALQEIDLIIPIPLHKKKQQKRGYNQCHHIARGLAEASGKPWSETYLIRTTHHESQTKKGRYERWLNVQSKFEAVNGAALHGKHVLLLDDVVTTGSTLEAAALELLKIRDVTISVATLACPAPF
jgi:ComF family protein